MKRLAIAVLPSVLALSTVLPQTVRAMTPSEASSAGTTNYLYVEVGRCPDTIEVFAVSGSTLTLASTVQVGCEDGGDFGGHHLRRISQTKSGAACLFLASDGDNGVGADVYSMVINGSTGGLTVVSTVGGGEYPTDLLVVGRDLVETDPPSPTSPNDVFYTYAIHNNCSLTSLRSTPMPAEVVSTAGFRSTEFVAPFYSGSVGVYELNTRTGALTLKSTTSEHASGLDSAAAQVAQTPSGQVVNVFIGQAIDSQPEVEAAQVSASGSLLPFMGSPRLDGDTAARDGVGLLVVGSTLFELNTVSDQVAWYQLTAANNSRVSSAIPKPAACAIAATRAKAGLLLPGAWAILVNMK
jgi:hypothetical protein